jgi:molecular chaperone GrpE (heat shock protein)
MSWFGGLFNRKDAGAESLATTGAAAQEAKDERELLESVQRLTRAQAKLAMRVEELDNKVEGGFADLGARLSDARKPASPQDVDWDELLDAVDVLAAAVHHADGNPALAQGLEGVLAKIERFLAQLGIERRAPAGAPPDGRLFRVVGAEPSAALPEGVVARVVRAAVLRGDQVLREGEVIVTRRTA